MGEVLDPTNSSVDDMVRNLSDTQKEMIVFGVQDVCNQQVDKINGGDLPIVQPKELLIESLAQDETMLMHLEEIFNQVAQKLKDECGEQQIWIGEGGSIRDRQQQPMMQNNMSMMDGGMGQ